MPEANIGIAEVDTFFIHTNELFALLQRVEENTAFIEMVPEPYFDEEMGVTDTIWNAKNKNTNEPIAKNDALKVYSIATLNLTEAAARGVSLTAESVSALASLTSDPLKALTIGKKVKQATKAIKMSVNVIPLIQRNIKENTEKLKYKKANERFIPPYESGAALYIRPLLIGTGAQVGVHPANEYLFVVFVTPVGPYFKGGFSTNPYVIIREFDRAAPYGTGRFKVGGNYAASLRANKKAHDLGYSCEFYLDAKEKKYIDECGAANFFGIKNNTYITPKSSSILPSITNKSLMQLAEDLGIKVECRPVPEEELETFEEAGACGTAAVISPIQRIDDLENKKSYIISKDGKPGPVCTKLYNKLRAIQYGDEPDTHNWVTILD